MSLRSWEFIPLEAWPRVRLWSVLALEIPDERVIGAGLTLIAGMDDGLGEALSTGARLSSGRVCALYRHIQSPSPQSWVLDLQDTEGLLDDVNEVLENLRVEEVEISWVSPKFNFAPVKVMRQDDNGINFAVGNFRFRATAQRMAEIFEARGHKQMYWVQAIKV